MERVLLLCTTPQRYAYRMYINICTAKQARDEMRLLLLADWKGGNAASFWREESKFTLLNRNHHRRCCRRVCARAVEPHVTVAIWSRAKKHVFDALRAVVVVALAIVGAGGENIYVHAQCACQCRLGM